MAAVLQRAVDDLRGSPHRRRDALASPRTGKYSARPSPTLPAAIAGGRSASRTSAKRSAWSPAACGASCGSHPRPLASRVAIHTVSSAEGAEVEARYPGDIPARESHGFAWRSLTGVLALVVLVAGAWAVLATLFTPPLTSGWREGLDATLRRWARATVVLGLTVAALAVAWLLVVRLLWDHSSG